MMGLGVGQGRTRKIPPSTADSRSYIAEVISDSTGGGYYNCYLQELNGDNWDQDSVDPFENTTDQVVVLNLAEINSTVHNLDAGDKIRCRRFRDTDGTIRYEGNEVFGRHTFGEW
jgi:hypothetical protein